MLVKCIFYQLWCENMVKNFKNLFIKNSGVNLMQLDELLLLRKSKVKHEDDLIKSEKNNFLTEVNI